MLILHEIVELVKALAWPCVVLYVLAKFQAEIRSFVGEMPGVVRRVRSAHGLGLEIELEKIDGELPLAELQAQSLLLKMPTVPPVAEHKERYDNA